MATAILSQAPLSRKYTDLRAEEAASRIEEAKRILGNRVVILGHHYQRDEIIRHADFTGDSYKLSKIAANRPEAEFIVFCGVHFMAESADILTPEFQKVILPNMSAGCSMADMASHFQVKMAWKQLSSVLGEDVEKIVPVTYINSAANLKAFVGEHGGTVCTSTNAPAAVTWALSESKNRGINRSGSKVFFFPDQHLGRNTGVKLGFDPIKDMIVWDPFQPLGGNSEEAIRSAIFILWKGHCSVHQRFTVAQIEKARLEFSNVQILVHPECPLDVIEASDFNGSTEFIIRTIQSAEPGSIWGVGTEINLVNRLANDNPAKTIFCLDPLVCPCSTMYRIHPTYLLWVLESLVNGEVVNQVVVPEAIRLNARAALDQMMLIGT